MMDSQTAHEYLVDNYYVEEMPDKDYRRLHKILMNTPHKPWCRKQLASIMPNYGSECTCDEG